jgi:hypothetical protein
MKTSNQQSEHWCRAIEASKFWYWIESRGGVAVWHSQESSIDTWCCPVLTGDGSPSPKPDPSTGEVPNQIITDPEKIIVAEDYEVIRFGVGVERRGTQVVVNKRGSRRIHREIARINKTLPNNYGASFDFDYENLEAVIFAPKRTLTLIEWARENGFVRESETRKKSPHRVQLKHLLTEDVSPGTILRSMGQLSDLIQSNPLFDDFEERDAFRDQDDFRHANWLLDRLYDYCDLHGIWVE